MNKVFKKLVAFSLVTILIILSSPDIILKAAQGSWKTITNQNTVYDSIYAFTGDAYIAKKGPKMLLLDKNQNPLATYDSISYYDVNSESNSFYFKVIDNDKIFFVNSDNEVIIPEGYDDVNYYNNDLFVAVKNGKQGLINSNNQVIIPFDYDSISFTGINNEFYIAQKNGKYGFINNQNEVIIPFEYDSLNSNWRSDNYLEAKKDGKCGIISIDGSIVFDFIYQYAYIYDTDLFSITPFGETYYYCHSDGNKIEFEGTSGMGIIYAGDGFFRLYTYDYANSTWIHGYIKEGMVEPIGFYDYDNIQYMGDGYFEVYNGSEQGVIDASENLIIPFQSNYRIVDFQYGFFTVFDNENNYGLISSNSELVVPCNFRSLFLSDNNIVTVYNQNYEYETIDLNVMASLPDNFDYASLTGKDGYYKVVKDGKYALVNNTFEMKTPLEYDSIKYIGDDYFKVMKDGKYGIIDSNNSIIKSCTYDYIYTYNADYLEESDKYFSHEFTDNTIIMYKTNETVSSETPNSGGQIGKQYVYSDSSNDSNEIKTITALKSDLANLTSGDNVLFDYNSISLEFPVGIFNNLSKNDTDQIKLGIKETDSNDLKTENKSLFTLTQSDNIKPLKSFDINLNIGGTEIHELGDYVEIKIDLSTLSLDGIDPTTIEMYYYNIDTNKLEAMNAVYDSVTKTLTFRTNHFSAYILGIKEIIKSSPDTSDNTNILFYTILMLNSLGSLILIKNTKRRKDNNSLN